MRAACRTRWTPSARSRRSGAVRRRPTAKACAGEAQIGGSPSYVDMLTCLEDGPGGLRRRRRDDSALLDAISPDPGSGRRESHAQDVERLLWSSVILLG